MLGEVFEMFFGLIKVAVVVAIVSIIGLIVMGLTFLFHDHSIKSDKPIQPKIELVINNNQVDTVYIYEKPKPK